MSTFHDTLTTAVAYERIHDLLRTAEQSQHDAALRERNRHRTPRRRVPWWWRYTGQPAGAQ